MVPVFDMKKEYKDKYKIIYEEGHHAREVDQEQFQVIYGRRGELNAWDLDNIEVLVLSNKVSGSLERKGWTVKNDYDDGKCFVVPKTMIDEACLAIKAKKKKQYSPETIKKLSERLFFMRSKRFGALIERGTANKYPKGGKVCVNGQDRA